VVRKAWAGRVSVAQVYPNTYYVGMSNLGFQTVYRLMNELDHLVCERVFLLEDGTAPLSLESGRPLSDFDVIAFSLSFESDYLNILWMLDRGGIPLRSRERGADHPLVMAGGIAPTLNPEPIADFIDCFLIGEAEGLIAPFFAEFDPDADRGPWLRRMARNLAGVYVPACYGVRYGPDGTVLVYEPCDEVPDRVRRAYCLDLNGQDTCSVFLTPHTTFQNTFLVEIGRGCAHGCRFCSAGYAYRPPRFRSAEDLIRNIAAGAKRTDRIGLMGAAVSDLPELRGICAHFEDTPLHIAFSSLRADAMTPSMVQTLARGGVKTATLAPDAGSERMRAVINKGISEDHILNATQLLVDQGVANLKLYFMIGLPTETPADVKAIPALCRRVKDRFLRSSRPLGRMGEITISLNSFVPKPVTPFQWAAMEDPAALKQKIKSLQQEIRRVPNMRLHGDVPRHAYVQALLARGDRRTGDILALAHQNKGNWAQTFKASPLNPDFYVLRERSAGEVFPWEIIDHGVSRSHLWAEYMQARAAIPSPPCPMTAGCHRCGVCAGEPPATEIG